MIWTKMLQSEMEGAYRATEGLMDLVEDTRLDWKPTTGENWMSTSELLRHLTNACGACCVRFANDSWAEVMSGEAEQPATTVESVAEAKQLLAEDKRQALTLLGQIGEESLASRQVAAPWDPTERPLGQQLLQMVGHLNQHKSQLFYYLKLQGKPVNTFTLWGLPEPQGAQPE